MQNMGIPQNQFKFLPTPEAYLSSLEAAVMASKHEICFQFFSWEGDAAGQSLARLAATAASRGVSVNAAVDHYTNIAHNDRYMSGFPPLSSRWRQQVCEWLDTRRMFRDLQSAGVRFQWLNSFGFAGMWALRRNHKKLVVIDKDDPTHACAYVGGINPTDHNLSWRDFMIQVRGPAVGVLANDFWDTWNGINGGHATRVGSSWVLGDAPAKPIIGTVAAKMIDRSSDEVLLESAYLSDVRVTSSLENAAKRGVSVVVNVPGRNHKRLFVISSRILKRLARSGVVINAWTHGNQMTHARLLVADSWVLMGSCPFNRFTSGRNAEIGLVSNDHHLVEEARRFHRSIALPPATTDSAPPRS
jgi:phosphatidylserine/phosphatidylglycerophosphate/cardiolipin synthase-like enzyme